MLRKLLKKLIKLFQNYRTMKKIRHFLNLNELEKDEVELILSKSHDLKNTTI